MASPDKSSHPVPRRRKRRWGFVIVAVLLLGGAGYAWIERPWEPKPTVVATETVSAGPVSQVLAINGRIAARTSVTIRAAVSAQALTVHASIGDAVSTDQILVSLDAALVEAQVEQARSALDAQQVQQRQAEANSARSQALGDNATRASREDAELALAAAINETARLNAALEQAERQLAQYVIRAPMDGVVLARGVDAGQLVDPQTELFVLADLDELVVETDVDELYSSRVRTGLKALLKPVGASVSETGTVSFAAPTVDTATGGRAIKISFDEPVSLPVGQTVNANVIVEEVADALSVPRGAIVTEGVSSHVLVVENGVAVMRQITFDDWPADRVIVTDGLAEGDVVILDADAVEAGILVTAE